MVPVGIDYGLTSPSHATDKSTELMLRKLGPLLNESLSSRTVAGWTWREEMAFCSISHACSMGFKSGDLAGQSNRKIAACSRYRLVMRALCARALSSIRMKSGPIAPAYGRTWTSKISLTYLSAVSVPLSMTCRSVFPWALIPGHTKTASGSSRFCAREVIFYIWHQKEHFRLVHL